MNIGDIVLTENPNADKGEEDNDEIDDAGNVVLKGDEVEEEGMAEESHG